MGLDEGKSIHNGLYLGRMPLKWLHLNVAGRQGNVNLGSPLKFFDRIFGNAGAFFGILNLFELLFQLASTLAGIALNVPLHAGGFGDFGLLKRKQGQNSHPAQGLEENQKDKKKGLDLFQNREFGRKSRT